MQRHVINTRTPNVARVYDALLGGKDHYTVDRETMERLVREAPEVRTMAIEHRKWSRRAIEWLVNVAAVDQFIDCGCGLPTMENTHEVARRTNPSAKVVYVDNDPAVAAHGRALLEDDETLFVDADLTRPDDVFGDERVPRFLDLDRPVAIIQCATLHHIHDLARVKGALAEYVARIPSGSYVALTHAYDPGDNSPVSELSHRLQHQYDRTNPTTAWRTRAQIESLFDGLELVEPGLTYLREWHPEEPAKPTDDPVFDLVLAGVARKP